MPVKLSWGTQVRNPEILVEGLLRPLSSSYLPHPKGRRPPADSMLQPELLLHPGGRQVIVVVVLPPS